MKSAKDSVTKMEGKLKCVSVAHQSEKKCLVTVLSQGGSQVGGGKSESLRLQLVSLSARQKQLLQCFIKQKEISGKLAKLAQREKTGQFAQKTQSVIKFCTFPLVVKSSGSCNASTVILPNLVKHLMHLSQPLPPTRMHTNSCGDAIPPSASGNIPSSQDTVHTGQVGNSRTLVSLSQSSGIPSSAPPADKTTGARSSQQQQSGGGDPATAKQLLSSSELTQPVPLATLIQHNILQPSPPVLTCTLLVGIVDIDSLKLIMIYPLIVTNSIWLQPQTACNHNHITHYIQGCGFTGALLKDGAIEETQTPESPGAGGDPSLHQLPQQWVRSCWTRLGHCHKKISKKQAYNTVCMCVYV